MTHKHDHILLNMEFFGGQRFFIKDNDKLDFDWPPPERISFDGDRLREAREGDDPLGVFKRIRMSELTDEQIESIDGVARGAEYVYETPPGD